MSLLEAVRPHSLLSAASWWLAAQDLLREGTNLFMELSGLWHAWERVRRQHCTQLAGDRRLPCTKWGGVDKSFLGHQCENPLSSFGDPGVPQPLPTMQECCPRTPVAPRPRRACRGRAPQPPWSRSLAPHSPNLPSSRRHGLHRVHQVRPQERWRGSDSGAR